MTVESPCIKVCVMDPISNFCIGCGRTIQEIAQWGGLDAGAQQHIVDAIPERLKHMTSRATRSHRRVRSPQ
jgi:uncharacterized protein